jgi:hypothetical protein
VGCVGRGFDERLGRPPAGYSKCLDRARWFASAANSGVVKAFQI